MIEWIINAENKVIFLQNYSLNDSVVGSAEPDPSAFCISVPVQDHGGPVCLHICLSLIHFFIY